MKDRFTKYSIYGAYYLMLTVYLVASYFPEHRVWGFNWWAYYPDWVRWALFGLGALVPVILRFIPRIETADTDHAAKTNTGDRKFFIIAGVIATIFGSLFYLLRARTHFLGDGYQLLSELAKDSVFAMKTRNLGESVVHLWLKNVISGDGQAAALLSYQIISITAGLMFVVAVALFARKLYERTAERVLFLLGVCTGGYMLLFFGYVENYSLFVLSVLTFTLTGLLVAQGKTSRYWLLPPLIAAMFFHVLGVTLLPSALYLLISPTRFGRTVRAWRPLTKLVALLPIAIVAALVFYHFYTASYFFQFAFVPLFENRFTIEGYTLFSINHLVDFLNLLFLLVPGLLIVLVSLVGRSTGRNLKQRPVIYLVIMIASVLGAVFIFDPKLGMPRDWDLLAFAGIPLVVVAFQIILGGAHGLLIAKRAALLSLVLALLSLVPRAVNSSIPELGLLQIKDHQRLDRVKNRASYYVLINYLEDEGHADAAKTESANWALLYPQRQMVVDASVLVAQGRLQEATDLLETAVKLDPAFSIAHTNLAACYLLQKKPVTGLESALIACGLNPRDSYGFFVLGAAYQDSGDLSEAETAFLKSLSVSTTYMLSRQYLLNLYRDRQDTSKYYPMLMETARLPEAPMIILRRAGDYFVSQRNFRSAAKAYRRAMEKGLDSAYVLKLIEQYPDLRQLMQ